MKLQMEGGRKLRPTSLMRILSMFYQRNTIQTLSSGVRGIRGVSTTYTTFTTFLSKENQIGAFAAYYLSGKANLGASGFANKIKLWFAKLFIKPAFKKIQVAVADCSNQTTKKEAKEPKNCYATYIQGYEEYGNPETKKIWDQRLAETGHVCQTQTAERPKDGDCKYFYEQIKNNDKKWVCWY